MSAVLRQRGGSAPSTYLLKLIVAQIQEEEISEGEVGQVSYFLDLVVVEHEVDQGLQTNIQYSTVGFIYTVVTTSGGAGQVATTVPPPLLPLLHSGHNIRGAGQVATTVPPPLLSCADHNRESTGDTYCPCERSVVNFLSKFFPF